jgi:hypothetical protein
MIHLRHPMKGTLFPHSPLSSHSQSCLQLLTLYIAKISIFSKSAPHQYEVGLVHRVKVQDPDHWI